MYVREPETTNKVLKCLQYTSIRQGCTSKVNPCFYNLDENQSEFFFCLTAHNSSCMMSNTAHPLVETYIGGAAGGQC
jgi:hypothetical protein